jgi:tyrosyl-tRNA synthetase
MEELLTRGVEKVYPSKEELEKVLASGKKLKIYFGIDPTGLLHIGHGANLLKLREFQDQGHEIIILYGGFTAQIGDPTDKLATRQPLTSEQVKANAASYRELIGKILDLNKASVRFMDNEEWTNKLKPADLLQLASEFTVSQLLERDMFQERLKQGREVRLHEFLYPVFQAYDAVTLDVDMQIGGNDQTFNMLAGRTLMRKLKNKEKFVFATKLLVDPTGKKMGKTEGNMVTLTDAPNEMYGKVMSWPDTLLSLAFEICTRLPLAEMIRLAEEKPKEAKMKLAHEIVRMYHDEAAAQTAEDNFIKTFSKKEIPDKMEEAKVNSGDSLADGLVKASVVKSKSEFRRLLDEGAIFDLDAGEKITDPNYKIAKSLRLRVGKKRFINLIV